MEEVEKYIVTFDKNLQPTWIVPVVNPDGVIKDVRFNLFITSALIQFDRRRRPGTGALERDFEKMWGVSLRANLEREGWELLADAYHRDNADHKWVAYRKWMLDGHVHGIKVPPFPAEHLPSGVKRRRNREAPHQVEYRFEFGEAPTPEPEATTRRREARP